MKPSIPQRYYDMVAAEITASSPIAGLWAKAYAEAEGNVAKARALYLQLRAQQLYDTAKSLEEKSTSEQEAQMAKIKSLSRESDLSAIANLAKLVGWGYLILVYALGQWGYIEKHLDPAISTWASNHALSSDYSYNLRVAQRALLMGLPMFFVPLICFGVWSWAKISLGKSQSQRDHSKE